MTSDVPLDYAVFQLSPKRSHCELFVSYDGATEKLASGLVKPFVSHLRVAEEQVALAVKSIKLEVERYKNAETWFTKGTLERFVRFVSTPEVLEMVNTFDAEVSQLEAARRIYSQGAGDHPSSASGGDGAGAGATAASDATKKELLRAIDVRLGAVTLDLSTACSRAFAAGFCPDSVSELQLFADRFGAPRLSEACSKFMDLCRRRPDLFRQQPTRMSDIDHQSKSSTCQAPGKATFPLRRFSREPSPSLADEEEDRENPRDKATPTTTSSMTTTMIESDTPSTQSSQPQLTRRLSVQERINLFESKQKESSSSTPTPTPSPTPSASAGVGVKPTELRRLSSDVASSSDKAVLRRWSGATDMSIDVSGERKEHDTNSNANTPTPTSSSSSFPVFPPKLKDQPDLKAEEGDKEKDSKEPKLPVGAKFGAQLPDFSQGGSGSGSGGFVSEELSGKSSENVGLKEEDQSTPSVGRARTSKAASFGRAEDMGLDNQTGPWKTEQVGSAEQNLSEEKAKGPSGGETKPQADIGKNFGASATGFEGSSHSHQGEVEPKSSFRVAQRKTAQVVSESAASDAQSQAVTQSKEVEVGSTPELEWKDFENQAERFPVQVENSGSSRSKFQGHGPISQQMKPGGTREEGGSRAGKSAHETQETQKARQSKGTQGLTDELKMKANELEKLFAEHKLRAPADQSNSARRTRPSETLKEHDRSSANRKMGLDASPAQLTNNYMKMEAEPAAGSSSTERFNSTPFIKTVDTQDYDVTPRHNIYTPSFSDDSRGNFYQKYMQKRDAKLRQDWSSRKVEKEATMKAMQDSLEKSRAELKAKLAASAEKRNSVSDAHRRAEKLRSFSARSATKRGQQLLDSFMSDGDEDRAEYLGKKLSQTYLGDSSSRSAQSKKVLPNKNTTVSTPRNSTAPIPRSSGKVFNSAGGRRRLNSDNPLAQSVPNFSDLRKENTKPLGAGSKAVRSQARNHARKKSVGEDLPLVSEEKPRRSQSLRKSAANAIMLNDSGNSDLDDKEENEGPKPFPRKGNGNSGIGRSKAAASMTGESGGNGHALDGVSFETEEMIDVMKEEEDDMDSSKGRGEYGDRDNGKGRLSQGSDRSANSGYDYEDSDSFRFSEARPASEFPSSMTSLFRAMGSLQESPGESPGSWNSRVLQNPFSFSHDISDIEAADSPIGSPASWNFQSLTQAEAEAARMRKKWGGAAGQKPIVGSDSSHSLSRKDVTRGLKRFLKFGRKNRASESMADWISGTTSEGDDDTEDGREYAYRSSEDLRKSRMGFSHSHHSDDGFAESDLLNEQEGLQSSIPRPAGNFKLREEHLSGSSVKGPKSFFSLSNFRSKGSDSKHR